MICAGSGRCLVLPLRLVSLIEKDHGLLFIYFYLPVIFIVAELHMNKLWC
jgi:hypothetical protein